MTEYLLLLVSTVLINNFVLVKFLGLCPAMGVSKSVDSALGMGLACLATVVLWPKSYAMPTHPVGIAGRIKRVAAHLPGTVVALAAYNIQINQIDNRLGLALNRQTRPDDGGRGGPSPGGQVIGTHLKGAVDYRSIPYGERPTLLLMGNEQQGLPDSLAETCDRLARIPRKVGWSRNPWPHTSATIPAPVRSTSRCATPLSKPPRSPCCWARALRCACHGARRGWWCRASSSATCCP